MKVLVKGMNKQAAAGRDLSGPEGTCMADNTNLRMDILAKTQDLEHWYFSFEVIRLLMIGIIIFTAVIVSSCFGELNISGSFPSFEDGRLQDIISMTAWLTIFLSCVLGDQTCRGTGFGCDFSKFIKRAELFGDDVLFPLNFSFFLPMPLAGIGSAVLVIFGWTHRPVPVQERSFMILMSCTAVFFIVLLFLGVRAYVLTRKKYALLMESVRKMAGFLRSDISVLNDIVRDEDGTAYIAEGNSIVSIDKDGNIGTYTDRTIHFDIGLYCRPAPVHGYIEKKDLHNDADVSAQLFLAEPEKEQP